MVGIRRVGVELWKVGMMAVAEAEEIAGDRSKGNTEGRWKGKEEEAEEPL